VKIVNAERQIADSGLYLVPVIIGNLVPLVTLPIFTRILSPAEYGTWALATVYAVFLTGLANFGLTICYERNFFQYREGRQPAELLYSLLAFVTAAYLVGAGVTWVFGRAIAEWLIGSTDFGDLLFWTFCANGVSSLKFYYLIYLRNSGQAKLNVWFQIDETLLATVASLLLVAYWRVGVIGLPWGRFIAAAVVLILATVRFVRLLRPAFSSTLLIESLRLSYPLTPRIFMGVIGNNFDKYLLGLLASVGSVGIYSIGQRVSRFVFAYMTALENVFAPQVYERMFGLGAEGGRAIGRYLTPFAYASVAMAVMVSLFSEEVLTVLTPAAYHGAIPIVNLLSIYYAIMFFGKQPQLMYARKTYLLSVLTVVGLGANVGFNIVCIRLFGTIGAAMGTLLGGVLSVGVYNVVAWRYYRIDWEFGRLAAIFGTLLGCASLTILMRDAEVAYWLRLTAKVGMLGAYLWVGVRIGVVTRRNVDLVRTVIIRKLGLAQAAGLA
jgi:O-antigen/teichoic acid export membrane protein